MIHPRKKFPARSASCDTETSLYNEALFRKAIGSQLYEDVTIKPAARWPGLPPPSLAATKSSAWNNT